MKLLPALRRGTDVERSMQTPLPWDGFLDLVTQFSYNGVQYTQPSMSQEQIAPMFTAFSRLAYKQNSIVFACMAARQMLLSEARFCFRERRNGRPGNLFTNADLAPLEEPWPGATTGDLISRMELYSSLGGNWFGVAVNGGIRSLRPDWVKILVGSETQTDLEAAVWDADAVVVGYGYQPGGPGSGRDPVIYPAEQVAHYAPYPDPEAQFRGMSWLTPVIREVMADKAATDHKLMFFENGATPNLVVSMEVDDLQKWVEAIRKFSADHDGVRNAYKTMYLGAGMDAKVVGTNLEQMDFKVTQGAGETRIAAAARVPAVVAQISEGLQGSSLNAGNFESSMRMMADMMARPAWRNMAGSLERIINVPGGAELWYDDRDIPALKEDLRKAGERQQADATAINTLITAGFDPDSVVDAVTSGDFNRLTHTGMTSVQLQKPGTNGAAAVPDAPPPVNGNGNGNGSRSDDLLGELYRRSVERDERPPIENHIHMPALEPAQVTVPVTIEAPEPSLVTIEAARAPDVHVTVEPAQVEFAAGAIQVDAPITVEPSTVTVEAARPADVNVTVEPAQVTVEPAQVTVEAAPTPDVNVTVEPTQIGEGAVQVTVEPAAVTVEAAPVPEVHIHPPVQRPRAAKVKRDGDGTLNVTYEEPEEGEKDV